ncbi:uncharacterized protein LOC109806257 [Cajanus cajan]|uniref:uncharacterized protein LOC109806257 n=1 Tax=Cajanus cajan TaxID=3821 RepID=UPI00098DBE5D|nr:uncharacterized protein LOC109806257 [Cajanus cajan]
MWRKRKIYFCVVVQSKGANQAKALTLTVTQLKKPTTPPSTAENHRNFDAAVDPEMSLVDYASSSDDDVSEPTEEEELNKEEEPQRRSPPPQPLPPRTQTKSGSSSDQQLENKPHSSSHSVEKLPDASFLLNAPAVSSNLMSASDHFSRVAAAQAENASRKRDSNGMASSAVRSKVPRGNLPHSRTVPETGGAMLFPPQISGRKNVVTEDISKLFVKKHH